MPPLPAISRRGRPPLVLCGTAATAAIAVTAAIVALLLAGCTSAPRARQEPAAVSSPLDPLAERYVRLVLAVGQHDSDYVDAYYGPAEWRSEAEAAKRPLGEIRSEAAELAERLAALPAESDSARSARSAASASERELVELRRRYLQRQLESLIARVDMLSGRKMSFDEESRALYDAEAPTHPEEHFRQLAAELDRVLPGSGPLPERLASFRKGYVIPPERVDAVFRAAIDECRARTVRHLELPPGESFEVEYVKDKPWSAYNWY